ncbi:hypothetical protein FOZ61_004319, partial [Perkinsus olseni]
VTNVGRSAPHTCGPPNSEVKVAYNTMRAAASADTSSGLGDIYSKTLTDKDDTTIRRLPKRKSIINNMRLVRQKALNLPPPPKAVSGFDIPAQYQSTTIAGIARQTLYYDSGRDDVKRILVWCDMASMQEVCVVRCGRMVPCIFCLLPQRDYETYYRLFEAIYQLVGPDISSCIFDMEKAAIKAF